jgi:hypothetical protein
VGLGEVADQLDEVVLAVSLSSRELDQFVGLGEHGAFGSCVAGDVDAATASELQQALVAEQSEGAQHGVGIHPQDRREIAGWGQSFAGARLSVGDRPADLPGDLVVEQSRVGSIDIDLEHRASYDSTSDFAPAARYDVSLLAPDRPVAEPPPAELLIREARRRQRRRRLAVTGLVIAALGGVTIAATTRSAVPRDAPLLARPLELPSLTPGRGSILHIDVTTTEITPGHPAYAWRQELYEETSPPYLTRIIDKRLLGTLPGTEGVYGIGTEQDYDPTNNTIYDPPMPKPPPGTRSLTPAQEDRMFEPYEAQYMRRLRAELASGKARAVGRATVDGRAAIKIKFAGSDEIDYVAADRSYIPIETIHGSPSSANGQTINVYHTFEFLPAAGNAGLLSLTAQHPSARIDRSLRDFRAAGNRLFPNG